MLTWPRYLWSESGHSVVHSLWSLWYTGAIQARLLLLLLLLIRCWYESTSIYRTCNHWLKLHGSESGPGVHVCPQRKPERQKMPATTHVLYQSHHYAPGDWLAATDHRSMTHYICCKLLSSVDRQISLRTRDQHSTPTGVYVVTLERLINFWVEPAHHGMK